MSEPGDPPDFSDPTFFARTDPSDDAKFYEQPRLVLHVDEHASAALTDFFDEYLPLEGDILDLMSAWRSHMPDDERYRSVTGHGMNAEELAANPVLTSTFVQDLNDYPALPFEDGAFDVCVISFSVQYLTQPVAVFGEIARVLRPSGALYVAYSNRLFPSKAVAIWQGCSDVERAQLIAGYARAAGGFGEIKAEQIVDAASGHDPLYVVSMQKA